MCDWNKFELKGLFGHWELRVVVEIVKIVEIKVIVVVVVVDVWIDDFWFGLEAFGPSKA